MFVETGFATELTPNYDMGAMVHNDYFNQPIGYAVGLLTGAGDNQSQDRDVDEGKDVVARLFLQPFLNSPKNPLQGLGFGAAGTIGSHTGGTLPTYTTPGQQTFFAYTNLAPTGIQYRIDPQLYYYYGPFGVEAEYILSSQQYATTRMIPGVSRPRFNDAAWQVEASYFITGEKNSFKATSLKHVEPLNKFGLGSGSGWGAFEVVGRLQELTIDDGAFISRGANNNLATIGSANKATSWGAGLNWYLNSNVKLNLDYESTTFTGGVSQPGTTAFKPEHVILSQAQIGF
jgi:phosphate-selective porin OprO/OprP